MWMFAAWAAVVAAAPKKLPLVIFQPMSGGWAGGIAMSEAMRHTLLLINANPDILPDYEAEVLFTNSECSPDVAMSTVLDLFFNGNLPSLAFNTLPNGDLDIFTWETETIDVGNMGASQYVGILGAGCSGATMAISKVVAKARKPHVSQSATSPALTDRAQYPYFWRAPQPDTNSLQAMTQIAATMADEVTLWSTPSSDGWTKAILETLLTSDLTVTGGLPFPEESGLCSSYCADAVSTACKNCRGNYLYDYMFEGDGYTEAKNLAGGFKPNPSRLNFFSVNGDAMSVTLCALKMAGVYGVVPFSLAWASPTPRHLESLNTECTFDDIKTEMRGGIGVGGVNHRVDAGTERDRKSVV